MKNRIKSERKCLLRIIKTTRWFQNVIVLSIGFWE